MQCTLYLVLHIYTATGASTQKRITIWHFSNIPSIAKVRRSWLYQEMVKIVKLAVPIVSTSTVATAHKHVTVYSPSPLTPPPPNLGHCSYFSFSTQFLMYFFQQLLFFLSLLLVGHSTSHSKTKLDAAGM